MVLVHVHRFPNKQNHTRNPPKRNQLSTHNLPKRRQPSMRNPSKRNRRGGACVPARTSAQRRFHTKKYTHCVWGIERWMRPYGATRAGTQAPPLPISTKPRGVPIPHRGYTFDSAGLASVMQPTLGNDASEEATPLGVVLFSSHIITTRGE